MAERTPGSGSGRTGRRAGSPETKAAILVAARDLFAQKGFAASTVRQIALNAGVDAAMIHHYFGSKDQLFLAAAEVEVDIPARIAQVLAGDIENFGIDLVRTIVTAWESEAGPGLLAAFRTALADPASGRMLKEFLGAKVLGKLAARLPFSPAESAQRVGLVASQIVGLVTVRYLLALPPVATLRVEDVVLSVGPTLQRYLTGDLGWG